MNPKVRALLTAATVAMFVVGAAAVAWKWRLLGGLDDGDPRQPGRLAILFVLPAVMAVSLPLAIRHLASDRPRLADDHRRHLELSLISTFLFATAAQVWSAVSYVAGQPLGRDAFIRLVTIWVGTSLAVRGNFFAKVAPPTGELAPEPRLWTRAMLRAGWILVSWGLALTVCGIVLPPRALLIPLLATAPVLILVVLNHRRGLRAQWRP